MSLEEAAKAQADLEEDYWSKPYFTIIPGLVIPDYNGDKYYTTHRCFGSPCPKDEAFLQTGEQTTFTDHPDPAGETPE